MQTARVNVCGHPDRYQVAHGQCRPCYQRQYKREHPVPKERQRVYNQRQWAANKAMRERVREQHLQKKYGLSAAEYEAILKQQNGVCAVCLGKRVSRKRKLDVDHCHRTGRVRGLLCSSCNVGLGHFLDDPELIRALAAYVEKGLEASSEPDASVIT